MSQPSSWDPARTTRLPPATSTNDLQLWRLLNSGTDNVSILKRPRSSGRDGLRRRPAPRASLDLS
jgi:hypothetical protein